MLCVWLEQRQLWFAPYLWQADRWARPSFKHYCLVSKLSPVSSRRQNCPARYETIGWHFPRKLARSLLWLNQFFYPPVFETHVLGRCVTDHCRMPQRTRRRRRCIAKWKSKSVEQLWFFFHYFYWWLPNQLVQETCARTIQSQFFRWSSQVAQAMQSAICKQYAI